MPLFAGDYLADTDHLTTEEHGAYLLLLMAMWRRRGRVPDDDKDLARMTRLSLPKWRAIKKRLSPLLIFSDGEITQKRLQKELKNAEDYSKSQSEKARKRWADVNNKTNGLAHAEAMPDAMPEACPHNHIQSKKEQEETQSDSLPLRMNSVPNGTGGKPPDGQQLVRKQVWEEGKALFVQAKGISDSTAGGLVTKLVKASNNNLTAVLGRIREARQQSPPLMDPFTWVMGRVSTRKAETEEAMAKETEENWLKKVREIENGGQSRDVH